MKIKHSKYENLSLVDKTRGKRVMATQTQNKIYKKMIISICVRIDFTSIYNKLIHSIAVFSHNGLSLTIPPSQLFNEYTCIYL